MRYRILCEDCEEMDVLRISIHMEEVQSTWMVRVPCDASWAALATATKVPQPLRPSTSELLFGRAALAMV